MSEQATAAIAVSDDERREALRKQLHDDLSYMPEEQRKELLVLVKSGFFSGGKDPVKAIYEAAAKIGIGASIGLSAQAALRGVILQQNGMPTFSANTMSYLIRKSEKYDYDYEFVKEKDVVTGCKLTFFKLRGKEWVKAGTSEFGKKDADLAGLSGKETFKKYPANMYFARAMTNGAKWACPDVFEGVVPYLPDEVPGASTPVDYATVGPEVKVMEFTQPPRIQQKPQASGGRVSAVEALLRETETDTYVLLEMFDVGGIPELTDAQADKAIDFLEKKKRALPAALAVAA